MQTNIEKARRGVFTPWATVQCLECDYQHYAKDPRVATHNERRWNKLVSMGEAGRKMEHEKERGEELSICDTCRCPCWNRFDVALCQQVIHWTGELSWEDDTVCGGQLEQTGGMCCAAVFHIYDKDDEEQRVVVVTEDCGSLMIGEYVRTDEPAGEPIYWQEPTRTFTLEFATIADEEGTKTFVDLDKSVERIARMVIKWIKDPEAAEDGEA